MAANGKSRMVSFRLRPEEYERFRGLCSAGGGNSVSELLRTAVSRFLEDGERLEMVEVTLERRVTHLESELRFLMTEVRTRNDVNRNENAMSASKA